MKWIDRHVDAICWMISFLMFFGLLALHLILRTPIAAGEVDEHALVAISILTDGRETVTDQVVQIAADWIPEWEDLF